ncbi:MAG: flavin monoamine oxidase family protein [Luteibaculaceae bacterium]
MNRRDFLYKSGLLSVGSLLVPHENLFHQVSKLNNAMSAVKEKVIVVGAGAAGLYAAFCLKQKGVDFLVLEAASTYGGRLGKIEGFANYTLDSGAQWLHGKRNLVGALVKESKTKITLDSGNSRYWFNRELKKDLPKNVDIFKGNNLPDLDYQTYALQQGLGQDYQFIIENLAGDLGAAASRLSVYHTAKEDAMWTSGKGDFKFESTYFEFIEQHIALAVKDKIILNTAVKSIDYSTDTITLTDASGNTYSAQKVILTVPVSILKRGDIAFTPPLPANKTEAFSKIGMDAGIKVFLKFKEKFYHQYVSGGEICAAYIDDAVGKPQHDNVLMAFVMGTQAEKLSALGSDLAIEKELLKELDAMYRGKASKNIVATYVQDWSKNPFVAGAYSYGTVGMGNARAVAAESVEDKLFFAGEAMNLNGHHATVQGAMETGRAMAVNIIEQLERR